MRDAVVAVRPQPLDAGKLADWDAFVTRMRPDTPPPVDHVAIDNGGSRGQLVRQVGDLAR